MHKHNVYLFQPVQADTLDQNRDNNRQVRAWMPYATARLWAYVDSFTHISDNFQLKKIFPIRKPVERLVDQVEDPTICGFSSYIWNFNYNIEVAKRIKQKWPNCKIVFGGPEVSVTTQSQYSDLIDTTIEGEGELLFKRYLEDYLAGETKARYTKERIRDVTELVSPYTTKLFDNIIDENPGYFWNLIMETNRGCPYACTFCDWGSATNGKIYLFPMETIEQELAWIKSRNDIYMINLGDANFGILKERDYNIANMLVDCKLPGGVDTSWSKAFNDFLPKTHEVIGRERNNYTQISLQTGNAETLTAIKRKNLNEDQINKLLDNNKDKKVPTNHEYILGLPLETKQSWYRGMTDFLDSGYPKQSVVYFCTMLPNTEMATAEYREQYKLETVKTSVSEGIMVNSDGILETSEIVKSTSTMTFDELVDCYLFGVMLTNTYNTGYTRLASSIASKNFGVKAFEFYTKLEEYLQLDSILGEHLKRVRNVVVEMFETGSIKDPLYYAGARLDNLSYTVFYKNKKRLSDITLQVFSELTGCDSDYLSKVKKLHDVYTFDLTQPAEQELVVDFNVDTGLPETKKYKIKHKLDKKYFLTNFNEIFFIQFHINQQLINEFTEISTIIPIVPV